MWNRCLPYLSGIIVGFIVAFLIARCSLENVSKNPIIDVDGKRVEVRLVTKIDTVYQNRNIYKVDSIKIPTLVRQDTVFVDRKIVMIPAVKREYRDSIKVEDSIHIGYVAHTTGTLDNIKLSYSNRKSVVVIHKTDSVFTNTIIKKNAGGLFIGIDGGYNQVTPKLEYIKNKNAFSAGYNIISNSPQIGYSRRIF